MKYLGFLLLLSSFNSFAISVNDLRTIVNDEEISKHLKENRFNSLESIGNTLIISCGGNSTTVTSFVFYKSGEFKKHELDISVGPADGNCRGTAPRKAHIDSSKQLEEEE